MVGRIGSPSLKAFRGRRSIHHTGSLGSDIWRRGRRRGGERERKEREKERKWKGEGKEKDGTRE